MKVWLGGMESSIPIKERIVQRGGHVLCSYFYLQKKDPLPYSGGAPMFLDSGAFSAYTQGITLDLESYAQYVTEHSEVLDTYANVDVIGSAEGTLRNQEKLERLGIFPLPVFHYGEPWEFLDYYVKNYDYIALGGMVPITTRALFPWLDYAFKHHICDEKGCPRVKVHGFGLTSPRLMWRYPWFSVDSTSWIAWGRVGVVLVPRYKNGVWVYDEDALPLAVGSASKLKREFGKHLDNVPPKVRERALSYVAEKGYVLGQSTYEPEDENYALLPGQRYIGVPENGKVLVETVVENGLSNCNYERCFINIDYYIDLERAITRAHQKKTFCGTGFVGFGMV